MTLDTIEILQYTIILISLFILLLLIVEFYLYWRNGDTNQLVSSNRYIQLKERAPNIDIKVRPNSDNEFTEFTDEGPFRYRTDGNSYVRPSNVHEDPQKVLVFLGGSSTECYLVEETERFPSKSARLIEEETGLAVNSYNAAVGGGNSLHSINILLNKALALDPDYVFYCHNWNDLNILLFEKDFRNENPSRRTVRTANRSLRYHLLQVFNQLRKATVPRTSSLVINYCRNLIDRYNGRHEDDFGRHRGREIQIDEEDMLSKYRANIITFITICRSHDIEPVLMTQQNRLTEYPDQIIKKRFDWFYTAQKIEYSTYREIYQKFNTELREISRRQDVICIDLDEKIPSISEHMYDVIHFTTEGSRYASRVIANAMKKELNQGENF